MLRRMCAMRSPSVIAAVVAACVIGVALPPAWSQSAPPLPHRGATALPKTPAERVWMHSGSATIDLLLDRAIRAMAEKKPELALKLLDHIVVLAPDFTEAWNRRAYVYFVQNDVERALGDLRRALALDPNHFKALDGLAQILREIGQKKAALEAFKQLLDVHPYWPGAKQAVEELEREVDGQGI